MPWRTVPARSTTAVHLRWDCRNGRRGGSLGIETKARGVRAPNHAGRHGGFLRYEQRTPEGRTESTTVPDPMGAVLLLNRVPHVAGWRFEGWRGQGPSRTEVVGTLEESIVRMGIATAAEIGMIRWSSAWPVRRSRTDRSWCAGRRLVPGPGWRRQPRWEGDEIIPAGWRAGSLRSTLQTSQSIWPQERAGPAGDPSQEYFTDGAGNIMSVLETLQQGLS